MSEDEGSRRSLAAIITLLRVHRRSHGHRDPVPRVSRTRAWLVAAPLCALLVALPALQALSTREGLAAHNRRLRTIGAAPAGRDDRSPLRVAALERFSFQQQYLRYPTGATGETGAWSPDGTRLVTGSGDGTVVLWRAADGRRLWTIDPAQHPIASLAWSPDGLQLLVGIAGDAVLALDARTARVERRFAAAPYVAPAMAYSPDGRQVAIASGRGEIDLWSIVAGHLGARQRRLVFGGATTAIGWSPDGGLLAVGGMNGALTIWSSASGKVRLHIPAGKHGTLWSLQWSRTALRLALGWADGTVRILAGPGLVPVRTLQVGGAVNTLGWSADATLLAVTAVGRATQIWAPLTGSLIARLDTGWDTNQIAWSADGRLLAAVTDGHDLRLWRMVTPTGGLGGIICRIQPDACAGLAGPRAAVPSYMGR